ncbi:MAG TPA: hypothetical protein GXZ98_06935 [Firmicutes bacterium]|jgi:uncharacterized protein|nr:hypothetical protein [Bacillota bacterium]
MSGVQRQPRFGLIVCLVALGVFVGIGTVCAESNPALPFRTYLQDEAGLLPPSAAEELVSLLAQFDDETGNQFLVAILPTLPPGESLELYALRVAEKAGAGQKGKDNGLLLLIGLEERLIRIEVGTGLEGQITDGRAGRVIRQIIAPAFQQENYAGGIREALVKLMEWVEPSFTPAQTAQETDKAGEMGGLTILLLFIAFFLISSMYARWERRRGIPRPPRHVFVPPTSSARRSSRSLSRSGSSSRRGGFRGGGGGFRGGGASGGW